MQVGSRRARKTVEIDLRCNYLVNLLGLRTNISIKKVRRTTTHVGAKPGDRLVCSRGWPRDLREPARGKAARLGRCSGILGFNARATITIALTKAVCRPKRLRVHVVTRAGGDCRGSRYPCPCIGFDSTITRKVAGC